ncbi:MAG: DUF3971 domain-containing protein [Alphaproteobacteria bacterium]|jgi:hypothetical protein|nr:DUF3971 domain-containing protein [Alphaproteobacteria bacterium]
MILFEIPIPFVAKQAVQRIYNLNPEFKQNNIELSIKSVAVGWDYGINRPVILLKGISYNSKSYSVNLNKVGFYPHFANSLRDNTLYLQKVFLEGLNFIVVDDKTGYKVTLDDKNLLIKDESNKEVSSKQKQTSFLESIKLREDFKNGRYFQLIDSLKSESQILKYLDEFIVYQSNVIFISQQKKLLMLNIDNFYLKRNPNDILINLNSNITFDNNVDKFSTLTFQGSINSNNTIKWDASLERIMLASLHEYIFKDKFINDLNLTDFEGNINLTGLYTTKKGLQDLTTTAEIKQGTISYKNYISKPLKVNSLNAKLTYNNNDNTLNINNFDIAFTNNNMFSSNKLGLNILLNRLTTNLKYNFNDSSFTASDINILSGSNKLIVNVDYLPYLQNESGHLNLNAKAENIDVGFVKLAWPKNYLANIRKWIVENVAKGTVDNTSFKMSLALNKDTVQIDTLEGDVFLSDATTSYLKGLPDAVAKTVAVKYNLDETSIKYTEGTTGKITSSDGEIKFFKNKNNPEEYLMSLDLKADTSITDALLFIDNKPLNLLEPTGLSPDKFAGRAKGDIKLKLSLEDTRIFDKNITLHLTDTSLKDALPNLDVSGGDLKFLLNDSGIKINGIISALYEQISLGAQINWENPNNIIQTYSVDINNFPIEKLNQLTFFDKDIVAMMDGYMDGNFTYYKDSSTEKLSFYQNLTNALFYIDVFNYKNKVGSKLTIEGSGLFVNNSLQEIKNLKLTADDLNVNMGLSFDKESKLDKMTFHNFYIKNKASFKGSIDFANNLKSFDLQGSLLDIAPILGYFRGNNNMYAEDNTAETTENVETSKRKRGIILRKESNKVEATQEAPENATPITNNYLESVDTDDTTLSEKIGNIRLKLAFDKVLNNENSLNNIFVNLLWKDNFIQFLNFSAKINNSKESSYVVFDEKNSILGLRITNLGSFLRLFEFSSNIENGDFEGKVNIKRVVSSQDENKFYIASDGKFTLNNFSVGIGFSSSYGEFRSRDLFFQLDKLELQGNLMGGNMQGYVDIRNNTLDIHGQLIPIWSINNIISNLPILKPLFENTPIPSVGSLLTINTRIRGPFNDIKYSIFTKDVKKGEVMNSIDLNSEELRQENESESINNNTTVNKNNEEEATANTPNEAEAKDSANTINETKATENNSSEELSGKETAPTEENSEDKN